MHLSFSFEVKMMANDHKICRRP